MGPKSKPATPNKTNKKNQSDESKEKVTELEKEFFRFQLADIEKKLARLAEREERLKAEKNEVEDKIEDVKKDKGAVVTVHEELLATKEEEKTKKREEMVQLSGDIKVRIEKHKHSIEVLEKQFNKMVTQLTQTIEELEEEIRVLEDYKQNKVAYNRQLEQLEMEMDEAEKEQQRMLFKIEKKWENARGRVKKELQSRLLQLSIEFRQTSQRKIGKPCHRVTQENKAIHTALIEMKEEIHQYNAKEATSKARIIEFRDHRNKKRDDKDKMIARTMIQSKIIKSLLKRQARLWVKLKAFSTIDTTNKMLLKKGHYVDSEIERKAAAIERVKQDIESKMEAMNMMKDARRFLKKNMRKMQMVLRNALRIGEEAAAVKLIPIGELDEEKSLTLDARVQLFKKRRQSVFDKRGRILQYLLETITKGQLTEEDRKFLRRSSESLGLEHNISMIYGKSMHSLDRELDEKESAMMTTLDEKGPFYPTSLTSLPRSVSTLVFQPLKKEEEEEESVDGEFEGFKGEANGDEIKIEIVKAEEPKAEGEKTEEAKEEGTGESRKGTIASATQGKEESR